MESFHKRKSIKEVIKPILIILTFILCMCSIILTYKAIRTPIVSEEKTIKNTIEEKISFDYAVMVRPSILYPEGGIVVPDEVIFNALTDKLILKLNADISSKEFVKFKGSVGVVYSIIKKDAWQREFELIPINLVETEGLIHNLLQEEIQLDISKITDFIDKVQEETKLRSGSNFLIFKPIIQGIIFNVKGEKIYEITNTVEIPFEVSDQIIKYAAEPPEKDYIGTHAIEDIKTVYQNFYIFGKEISIISARYTFGIISIILLLVLIWMLILNMRNKVKNINEINIIDEKYRNKIVSISDRFGFDKLPQLRLQSFKALLHIAEEKDEPILRCEDTGIVYYYVVGNATIYYYRVLKSIIVESSGITHEA